MLWVVELYWFCQSPEYMGGQPPEKKRVEIHAMMVWVMTMTMAMKAQYVVLTSVATNWCLAATMMARMISRMMARNTHNDYKRELGHAYVWLKHVIRLYAL